MSLSLTVMKLSRKTYVVFWRLCFTVALCSAIFFSCKTPKPLSPKHPVIVDIEQSKQDLGADFSINTGARDVTPKKRSCERSSLLAPGVATVGTSSAMTRFVERTLGVYLDGFDDIEGWLALANVYMVARLSKLQHEAGIFGTVGEIGVHHGKFTAALSGFAHPTEDTVAVDLFGDQDQNIDGSGHGDLHYFRQNLEKLSLWEGTFAHQANSLELVAQDFSQYQHFRMLSVDGGHTYETTLNDLLLACNIISEGGIIILDDFINTGWLGVAAGVFDFILSQETLVPFLWLDKKLFLTTRGHHGSYVSFLRQLDPDLCNHRASREAELRHSFHDHFVCIVRCDDGPTPFCDHMADVAMIKGLLDGGV